jgi:hypothetical protein
MVVMGRYFGQEFQNRVFEFHVVWRQRGPSNGPGPGGTDLDRSAALGR